MARRLSGAVPLLALGLVAAASAHAQAPACNAALLERLATPRVVTSADTYEVTMRRSLSATDRADALLLKDALRKALAKDPAQVMELRGVAYTPVVSCEGYRIVGLTVRKDNVSFVAAPPVVPPAAVPAASPAPAAPASVAAPAPAPAAAGVPSVAGTAATPAAAPEGAERQREWVPRELTPRELTPRELTPRELTPRELTPRELAPVPSSKPQ